MKPVIKDGDIISLEISNNKGVRIKLQDSYLLLKDSLLNLSKTFKCETIKGIEPVLISDNLNNKEKYYSQNSTSHYSKDVLIISDFKKWKNLIINYCENDCKVLYQILLHFRSIVFNKWELNIERFPTTPSLAFAIYRKNYLKKSTVPITNGEVFDFIKRSFTGGATDMYIPYGKKVRCYDVNSLYPSIMKDKLFPTGTIYKFDGDITILNDIYWIGEVNVSSKRDLFQPYLQIHYKINSGLRTISPNGSFSMVINSPEYINALKDYNIDILHGYFF